MDKVEKAIEGGVPISDVAPTQVDLFPGQAALVAYEDGVVMVLPDEENADKGASVPQHVMFMIGVYYRSADPAFVELMIRSGIDGLKTAEKMDD